MANNAETRKLFSQLVSNALNFLDHSIAELKESPKYSVIHFHAAVELFVKARLMREHWSLVVAKNKEPDWDRFVLGDFQSVSLDEAELRLQKVVKSGLTKKEFNAFKEVTKHRNKFVHFFHEASSKEENVKMVQGIVRQQLYAWYLLHSLISTRWRSVFKRWSKDIAAIDAKLREHHEFLRVIFDDNKDEIAKRVARGSTFVACPSCGFESQEFPDDEMDRPHDAKCLVCNLVDTYLIIECPNCQKRLQFVNEGNGHCENCDGSVEPDDLAEALISDAEIQWANHDGDDSLDLGNCSSCDGYHTVVNLEDLYFCTSCFGTFKSLQHCGWCSEPNTGDMDGSYASGCNFCDGHSDWNRDD
jgi:hypothetical protein